MMMRFYHGMTVEDVGNMTIGQMDQRIEDMGEILKMESGGDGVSGKPESEMTATEKIAMYKAQERM